MPVCHATKGRNVKINAHIFYEYFVRQSVGQTIKDINVKVFNLKLLKGFVTFSFIFILSFSTFCFPYQSVRQATKVRNVNLQKHLFLG